MTVMITEVYDAFIAAGTPEDKARKAAEALSSSESRFDALDRRIDRLEADIDVRFANLDSKINRVEANLDAKIDRVEANLKGDIKLLTWMLGFTLAFVVAIAFKLFLH